MFSVSTRFNVLLLLTLTSIGLYVFLLAKEVNLIKGDIEHLRVDVEELKMASLACDTLRGTTRPVVVVQEQYQEDDNQEDDSQELQDLLATIANAHKDDDEDVSDSRTIVKPPKTSRKKAGKQPVNKDTSAI